MPSRPLPHWLTVSIDPVPVVADGRACETRAAFFTEVARVLRLPGYFGHNWDALTDCLRDVTAAGKVTFVVEHAESLLAAEPPEQFAVFLDVMATAAADGLGLTLCTVPPHEPALLHRIATALS
ncbi:hypothetical protein Ssi03_40430 [Sphaerisporangium siamense]|uniref:RNAse (Barnase) inhibitor barstar n=1 Tax=Sphaerisporangium siamense TaxID=795645 RepID=A0A7W7D621_9ACTN|nr:barstar family protein [Sphaerisporangium siamense]MBB4700801.1 RNAse (barnase) inhibitor barstar [Sphaerisporangium siamense]GII86053.1 hypothetical protein Ssi03_40430 [Sphaerisporangium siamense]